MPLQEVIFNLRINFESARDFAGVEPILEDLLEPPEMANVASSFDYLFDAGMITTNSDRGGLTTLGRFAGGLSVDLQLIFYSTFLGLEDEACVMAAALSQSKSLE